MKSPLRSPFASVFTACLWLLLLMTTASRTLATTRTFRSAPQSDRLWSTAANWDPPGVPASGDTLRFDWAVTMTNDLTNLTVKDIILGDGTLAGNPVTLTGELRVSEASFSTVNNPSQSIALDIKLGGTGAKTWYIEEDGTNFRGTVDLNGHDLTMELDSGTTVEMDGYVRGSGALNFSGQFFAFFNSYTPDVYLKKRGLRIGDGMTRVTACRLYIEPETSGTSPVIEGPVFAGRSNGGEGGIIYSSGSGPFGAASLIQLGSDGVVRGSSLPRVECVGPGSVYIDRQNASTLIDGGLVVRSGTTACMTGLEGTAGAVRFAGSGGITVENGAEVKLQTRLDDNDTAADIPLVIAGGGTVNLSVNGFLPREVEIMSGRVRGVSAARFLDAGADAPHFTVRAAGSLVFSGPSFAEILYPDVLLDGGTLHCDSSQRMRSKSLTGRPGLSRIELRGTGRIQTSGMLYMGAALTGSGGVIFSGGQEAGIYLERPGSPNLSMFAGDTQIAVGFFQESDERLISPLTIFGDGSPLEIDFRGTVPGNVRVTDHTVVDIGSTPPQCVLTLLGNASAGTGPVDKVIVQGLNAAPVLRGSITIRDRMEVNGGTASSLTIAGELEGTGVLTKQGAGLLRFSGSIPGNFSGTLVIAEGGVDFLKSQSAPAFAGGKLDLASGGVPPVAARCLTPGGLDAATAVTVRAGASMDMSQIAGARPEVLGSLAGAGSVILPPAGLAVGADGSSTTFSGSFSGTGNLAKTGGGTFSLTGDSLHTGMMRVNGGTLVLNGRMLNSSVEVNGGVLSGTGQTGAVTVRTAGTLAPGPGAGQFSCGNLLMESGSRLQMELAGTPASPLADKLSVNGTVTLSSPVLEVLPGLTPVAGTSFRLIDNKSSGSISGTFAGVPQGSLYSAAFLNLTAAYNGGTGNDFTLTYTSYNNSPSHQPPSFPAPSPVNVNEGAQLDLTVAGTDPDPAQLLTYSLTTAAPYGLTLDAGTGRVRWSPGESDGGSTVVVGLKVTDNGSPPLSATVSLTIHVIETNSAPLLNDGENRGDFPAVDEGNVLRYDTLARDPDSPAQTVSFAFSGGVPAGMTIDPATGRITWPTTEADGGTSPTVTVVATDSGTPPLTTTQTYTIPVSKVENLPLPRSETATVVAGQLLSFSFATTDPDLPAQPIYYRIAQPSPPQPVQIISSTGLVKWQTALSDGPGTYDFTFIASNVAGNPGTNPATFSILTLRVNVVTNNTAPKLRPVPDKAVAPGESLSFKLTGTDSDLPGQTLTYASLTPLPAGMTLMPETGRILWTPSAAQNNALHEFTVQVSDSGTPPLSAQRTVRVFVRSNPPANPPEEIILTKRPANPGYRLRFTLPAGTLYEVQSTGDPDGTWNSRGVFVAAGGGETFIDASPPGVQRRFYRISVP